MANHRASRVPCQHMTTRPVWVLPGATRSVLRLWRRHPVCSDLNHQLEQEPHAPADPWCCCLARFELCRAAGADPTSHRCAQNERRAAPVPRSGTGRAEVRLGGSERRKGRALVGGFSTVQRCALSPLVLFDKERTVLATCGIVSECINESKQSQTEVESRELRVFE